MRSEQAWVLGASRGAVADLAGCASLLGTRSESRLELRWRDAQALGQVRYRDHDPATEAEAVQLA